MNTLSVTKFLLIIWFPYFFCGVCNFLEKSTFVKPWLRLAELIYFRPLTIPGFRFQIIVEVGILYIKSACHFEGFWRSRRCSRVLYSIKTNKKTQLINWVYCSTNLMTRSCQSGREFCFKMELDDKDNNCILFVWLTQIKSAYDLWKHNRPNNTSLNSY